eukprot:m.82366 g.82366  ORF g.82366 m.82366 type:complete len:167 (-) comp12867_c0_seq9:330-830(-)
MTKERIYNFQDKDYNCSVVISENSHEDYGSFTWPSAVVLAHYVFTHRTQLKGKRVLELGAGTALPGILACKLGASVVLSDQKGCQVMWLLFNYGLLILLKGLECCRATLEASSTWIQESKCSVVGIDWNSFDGNLLSLKVGIIMACCQTLKINAGFRSNNWSRCLI